MSSKLKQITTKAKALYKSGKYKKWTDAIKAASKTLTSKIKISKISGVNDVVWIFDVHNNKSTTAKKQIKVKAPNRTSAYNKARKRYPYPYFVELHSIEEKKIGSVKNKKNEHKRKKIVKKSSAKSYHKDTKSHNVNIRVMSGLDKVTRKGKKTIVHYSRIAGMPNYSDPDMARELELYSTNDSQLYYQQRRPILINLSKKYKKGTFDVDKAAKLWRYFVDNALQKYNKEFGSKNDKWYELMSVHDRNLLAHEFAEQTKDEFDLGNFTEK